MEVRRRIQANGLKRLTKQVPGCNFLQINNRTLVPLSTPAPMTIILCSVCNQGLFACAAATQLYKHAAQISIPQPKRLATLG